MWKRIKFHTVTGIIAVLAAAVLYLWLAAPRRGVTRRVVDAPVIVQEIQRLSELVTVKYNIQKIIGLEEQKIPFGSESVLMAVHATVKAGIDLSRISTNNVRRLSESSIALQLPAPRITDIYLDDAKTKVWSRSKTWWTPWVPVSPDIEQTARRAALEDVRAAALDSGILSNAQANAETTIRALLRALGIETVTFEPVTSAPRH
jgi:hypothetical protein